MPSKRTTKPRGVITLEDLLSKGYFPRGVSSPVMGKRRKKQAARGVLGNEASYRTGHGICEN